MKITSNKQPITLFILCMTLLSSVSLETFCVRKPSEISQIRKEKKQNEKRLTLWTGVSCALVCLGMYMVASTFPPAHRNAIVPATPPTPSNHLYGIRLDPSQLNSDLIQKNKKK